MSDYSLNFIMVGPYRTGTTWMYEYLRYHPQIAIPTEVKEIFFFDKNYNKGLDWYFSHFQKKNETELLGEVAPSYFNSSEAMERIFRTNPQCQIIITLREPISRLVSYYLHMKTTGEVKPNTSLFDAIQKNDNLNATTKYYSYAQQWLDIFGKNNVHFLFYEILQDTSQIFTDQFCQILKIESMAIPEQINRPIAKTRQPTHPYLTKIAIQTNRYLRSYQLHSIVNFAKKVGIRKLFFKTEENKYQFSSLELQNIFDLFQPEMLSLEKSLNLDLSLWKSIWQQKMVNYNF